MAKDLSGVINQWIWDASFKGVDNLGREQLPTNSVNVGVVQALSRKVADNVRNRWEMFIEQ